MAVDLRQTHFRFGVDELAESTHGWRAAEDTNVNLPVDTTFLLRFTEQESGGTSLANCDAQFQYNKNAAGWVNITTTSSIVKAVVAAAFANADNCTKRLSGTGTFESSGQGCTEDGLSGGAQNDIAASGNSETECALQIVGADVARGDTIQFRFTSPDATVTYTVTPTATVLGNLTMAAAQATFTETGNAAALMAGRKLAAAQSTFTLTGTAAAMSKGYAPLVAEVGGFALTGNAAVLRAERRLAASAATFSFTGIDCGLKAARNLAALTAGFTLSGIGVGLDYAGGGGGGGSFSLCYRPRSGRLKRLGVSDNGTPMSWHGVNG